MEPRDQLERDAVAAFLAKRRKAEERKARQEAKRKAEEEEKKRLQEEAEIRRAEEEKRKEEEARRKEEEAREQKEEEERAEREARRQKEEEERVEKEARETKEAEDSDENDSEEEPKQKKAKTEKTEEDIPIITYFPDDVSITSSEPSIGSPTTRRPTMPLLPPNPTRPRSVVEVKENDPIVIALKDIGNRMVRATEALTKRLDELAKEAARTNLLLSRRRERSPGNLPHRPETLHRAEVPHRVEVLHRAEVHHRAEGPHRAEVPRAEAHRPATTDRRHWEVRDPRRGGRN
jgi:flagellar biosynthesis GTPase FlhF